LWLLPYDRLQQGSRSYTLGNDKPIAYVFSHLVLASKFTMLPTNQPHEVDPKHLKLNHETMNIISDALE
jgi:hypothetical protein